MHGDECTYWRKSGVVLGVEDARWLRRRVAVTGDLALGLNMRGRGLLRYQNLQCPQAATQQRC